MCGIVSITGRTDICTSLLSALRRLEYRGYDSAGLAASNGKGISVLKTVGKVNDLLALFERNPISGKAAIGHTRWATHGAPLQRNAHPFSTKDIVLAHNGIIENYLEIKDELIKGGYQFHSETDTEVLACLIQYLIDCGYDILDAAIEASKRCLGLYAFVMMSDREPGVIFGIKNGLPLALGIGEGENYLGSDAYALSAFTNRLIYLNDREVAKVTPERYEIFDFNRMPLIKETKVVKVTEDAGKGEFSHYMLKEIYEQPRALAACLDYYCSSEKNALLADRIPIDWSGIKRVCIVACGTSYYSGCVAKYWFEQIAKLSVDVDIASEFRYREPLLDTYDIFIFISQSGETADTLAAAKMVAQKGIRSIAIVNVEESSIGNVADFTLPICAGQEIGVASTKAFTCQLMVLALLCIQAASSRSIITEDAMRAEISKLYMAPTVVEATLSIDGIVQDIARKMLDASGIIYIGRGASYPIALEAALKVKELAYIPALGIPAGELKHGPIALVDKNTAVCMIMPSDKLFVKAASNLQEAHARCANIILFSDAAGTSKMKDFCFASVELPFVDGFLCPIVYALPTQLLAYHIAVLKGNDVDMPRNLAKSVTVE